MSYIYIHIHMPKELCMSSERGRAQSELCMGLFQSSYRALSELCLFQRSMGSYSDLACILCVKDGGRRRKREREREREMDRASLVCGKDAERTRESCVREHP